MKKRIKKKRTWQIALLLLIAAVVLACLFTVFSYGAQTRGSANTSRKAYITGTTMYVRTWDTVSDSQIDYSTLKIKCVNQPTIETAAEMKDIIVNYTDYCNISSYESGNSSTCTLGNQGGALTGRGSSSNWDGDQYYWGFYNAAHMKKWPVQTNYHPDYIDLTPYTSTSGLYYPLDAFQIVIPAGYKYAGYDKTSENSYYSGGAFDFAVDTTNNEYRSSTYNLEAEAVINAIMSGNYDYKASNDKYYRLTGSTCRLNLTPNSTAVSYNANGGSGTAPASQTVVYNNTDYNVASNTFYRSGYTFAGWNTKSNGSGTSYAAGTSLKTKFPTEAAVTLYAQWERDPEYTITFRPNGGTFKNTSSFSYLSVIEGSTQNNSPGKASRTGYTFAGWNTAVNGGGYQVFNASGICTTSGGFWSAAGASGTWRGSSDITVYAQWTANQNTVTFDPRGGLVGGSAESFSQTMTYDSNAGYSVPVPTKDHYLFTGWYTSQAGGEQVYDANGIALAGTCWSGSGSSAAWKGTSNLTLYAQWESASDFSLNQSLEGIEFDRFSADAEGNASYSYTLSHDRYVLFPGIEKGVFWQTSEAASEKYAPAFESEPDTLSLPRRSAKAGQALSTAEEALSQDTILHFTNEKVQPEGTDITIRKKLSGDALTDADRERSYTFAYYLAGLDPEESYQINLEQAGGESVSILPGAAGLASGQVSLKEGQAAVFENLPEGCQYFFTEKTNGLSGMSVAWEVTDGEESTVADYCFVPANLISSTGAAEIGTGTSLPQTALLGASAMHYEKLEKDIPVEITFSNSRFAYHDLTVQKKVMADGQEAAPGAGSFRIHLVFAGLEPGKAYTMTGGTLTANDAGRAEIDLTLASGDSVIFRQLPGMMTCEITEEASQYVPSIEVAAGEETLVSETGSFNKTITAKLEGLPADTTATIQNTNNRYNDLSIEKEFTGSKNSEGRTASFEIALRNLTAGTSYTIRKWDGEGTLINTDIVTAAADGTAVAQVSLSHGQKLTLLKLPREAIYQITEAASDADSSFIVTEGEEGIHENSGSAGKREPLATGTEDMSLNRGYLFFNERTDNPPVKTVSDGDGITSTGAGEEIEVYENTVPKLTSSWVYHITQEISGPTTAFHFFDTLPPHVRTIIYDNTDTTETAPLRIYWTMPGGSRLGGAVTAFDAEEQVWYVKDGANKLFRVEYDDTKTEAVLKVFAESSEMLSSGGTFEIYCKAFLDPATGKDELISAGCYTGSMYDFVNSAATLIGTYGYETNEVITHIPEGEGLTIQKQVRGSEIDDNKAFGFTVDFESLRPKAEYSYTIPAEIAVSLQTNDGQLSFTAVDQDGKAYKDVTVTILNDSGDTVANLRKGAAVTLENGSYTAIFKRGETEVRAAFTLVSKEEQQTLEDPVTEYISGGGTEETFTTNADGMAKVHFTLSHMRQAIFRDLPDETIYRITEDAAEVFAAAYSVSLGRESVQVPENDNGDVQNKPLSTETETLQLGTPVNWVYTNKNVSNEREVLQDLILKKNVTGNLGDRTKRFKFTVNLTGLAEEATYQITGDDPKTFTSILDGSAEVTLCLQDDQQAILQGLPTGATYRITEAASDHAVSYQLSSEADTPVFAKASDSNGNHTDRSLATAEETVDPEDGTVTILFTNNKDLSIITGLPTYLNIWSMALLCILAGAAIWILLRYRIKKRLKD